MLLLLHIIKAHMDGWNEHEELVQMAVELRGLLFGDASDIMQGAMVGCPVECLAFAKWWIQRAKGIPFDDPLDACAFKNESVIAPQKATDTDSH